jgi:hypothetical protein
MHYKQTRYVTQGVDRVSLEPQEPMNPMYSAKRTTTANICPSFTLIFGDKRDTRVAVTKRFEDSPKYGPGDVWGRINSSPSYSLPAVPILKILNGR